MKNANIGIINLIISNKLKDSYFNNNLMEESKKAAIDFYDIIQTSPILQLESKVFNNMENKHIENELAATRYIDSNIKLFEVYTIDEIEKEREKLSMFVSEGKVLANNEKVLFYNAIDTLIEESLNDYDKVDVDKMHEAFTLVLTHLRTQKKSLVENIDVKPIESDVIEIAINKFNEKYDSLNEEDKHLFKILINADDKEKQELLELYKNENLVILEELNKEVTKDNITRAIQKIKEMAYIRENVDDDIISLHDLKKELL